MVIPHRIWVFARIAVVYAVYVGGLEDGIGSNLVRAQRSSRIRSKEGVARPAGKHYDTALFKVSYRSAPDERLGHFGHRDRAHNPSLYALFLQRILESHAVD